uniref:BAR/IMD domain containing adaptor protein 2 n=1 Tax=Oryzias sinensis TaxID=183150 RepID=A0A8C8DSB1_9TELE
MLHICWVAAEQENIPSFAEVRFLDGLLHPFTRLLLLTALCVCMGLCTVCVDRLLAAPLPRCSSLLFVSAGDVLFQMAEVHRQIQIQLEEMLKSFHNELLTELEKKVELDARYLNAALKKYQTEHKSKGESLEKSQAELKKLRRKSQGSKHPSKYGDKEMQYVEAISNKQSELDNYIAEGYKNALSEERRRYCFLVDRQCAVAKTSSSYHSKGKELLSQKVPLWTQACAEPNRLPDRAMFLAQQMSGSMPPGPHHHPGIPDPSSGAKPL